MPTTKYCACLAASLVFLITFAGAAGADEPITVTPASGPIRIDGRIDETTWQKARHFSLDIETKPAENRPAPVRTDAWVTYNDHALLIAFYAHDPAPGGISSHYTRRDQAYRDDFVGVNLDTFNDERLAYEFYANPLGVQMDYVLDDLHGREDSSFDAIWKSVGRVTKDGYVVEMAIPWRSLRLPATEGNRTFGIDLLRYRTRTQRRRFSIQAQDRGRNCYLCQLPKVTGFKGIESRRPLEVTPVLTSRQDSTRPPDPTTPMQSETNTDLGVDVRWGIAPNVTLTGTINPDFSEVEADQVQLSVNRQFSLSYDERRPFFLQGADVFTTQFDAVYTRTIASPDWGAKLTGKHGDDVFGAFVTGDSITNLILPGPRESDYASLPTSTRDTVARYRRDIGNALSTGVLLTDRHGEDGYSNRVAGADLGWRLDSHNGLQAQWLGSRTQYPDAFALDRNQPLGSFADAAWRARYDYSSRNWSGNVHYEDVGNNFRADLGFMPQVGYRLLSGDLQYDWYASDDSFLQQAGLNEEWHVMRDQDGHLIESTAGMTAHFDGAHETYLEFGPRYRRELYAGRMYYMKRGYVYGSVRPSPDLYFAMNVEDAESIDYLNARPGNRFESDAHLDWWPTPRWHAVLRGIYERFDVDSGRLYTVGVGEMRLAYHFTRKLYVRLISQYQHQHRHTELYQVPVPAVSRQWANQFLVTYLVNPRTVIYAGYSDGLINPEQRRELVRTQRTVFLKLSYAWQT